MHNFRDFLTLLGDILDILMNVLLICYHSDSISMYMPSGEVLVVLDLRPDESLLEAGFAREVRAHHTSTVT